MKRTLALASAGVLLAVTAQSAALAQYEAAAVRYEAESATCEGTVDSDWAGFSGAGFCNATNAVGQGVTVTVDAATAGTATLGIRYANGTTTGRPADVSVNGTVVSSASTFDPTGAWTTWVTKTLTVNVNAGANTVRVAGTTANGPANIDYLEIDQQAAATDYQAENCTISQGVAESNWAGFTGTGFVNYDNVTGSYVECAVSSAAAGNAVLTFRYANGTTTNRPLNINGTTVNFPGTGAWTTWAEVNVTVSLNAGTTLVRAASTTVNGGPNLDRIRAAVTGPPDTTPPSVPGSARVTGVTCNSISLAWNASTDNVSVAGYRVFEGTALRATVTGTTATLTGLAPGTSHTYQVRAFDGSGNESASASVTATTATSCGTGRPADINGQLHVCGVQLCNRFNRPIQLRGMSSHGLQWYNQCLNTASLDALANDWQADVFRISMYIQEDGYETNPRLFTDRVHSLIEMATARGMYAIVDWHMLTPGDPNFNLDRARTFFTEIANRHKAKTNIIYEVANEPNGVGWTAIRNYHQQIIPVIRAEDADAVILLGTRAWSSLGLSDGSSETEIINNPVSFGNIMYTFHFYAASHGSSYLNALSRAADRIPMFVTEFGTQTASGDGTNNFTQAQAYLDLMATKKISWVNWNYSDDSRSGAVFTPGTCPGGPFAGTTRLKPAGTWVRDHIRNPPDNFPTS